MTASHTPTGIIQITESASVFCGPFCASATCYGTSKDRQAPDSWDDQSGRSLIGSKTDAVREAKRAAVKSNNLVVCDLDESVAWASKSALNAERRRIEIAYIQQFISRIVSYDQRTQITIAGGPRNAISHYVHNAVCDANDKFSGGIIHTGGNGNSCGRLFHCRDGATTDSDGNQFLDRRVSLKGDIFPDEYFKGRIRRSRIARNRRRGIISRLKRPYNLDFRDLYWSDDPISNKCKYKQENRDAYAPPFLGISKLIDAEQTESRCQEQESI